MEITSVSPRCGLVLPDRAASRRSLGERPRLQGPDEARGAGRDRDCGEDERCHRVIPRSEPGTVQSQPPPSLPPSPGQGSKESPSAGIHYSGTLPQRPLVVRLSWA